MDDRQILINLTADQWNIVLAGLQELQAKVANPIITVILAQAKEQLLAMDQKQDESSI